MKYAICEIAGKQYFVAPGKKIEVDKLADDVKTLSVDKVMLLADDKKIEVGKPYLKEVLDFDVVETVKKPKIRVATYKAKANHRRVKGHRQQMTVVQLKEKKG